jgi:hypothetical protein
LEQYVDTGVFGMSAKQFKCGVGIGFLAEMRTSDLQQSL